MREQMRSELVKLRSTRTNLGLLFGMVGLVLLIVIVTGAAVTPAELAKDEHQRALFGLGLAGGFIASLIGVMSITSEYRHGTIRPTFVFTPRRGRVVSAKVFSSFILGVIFGLITEAVAFAVGLSILAIRGVDVVLPTHELLVVALGSIACAALMAALGVGVGAVARNQVLAVIGVVVWFMVVENVVVSVWPEIGKFFPLAAGDAMTGINSDQLLTAPQGALVLVGYVLVLLRRACRHAEDGREVAEFRKGCMSVEVRRAEGRAPLRRQEGRVERVVIAIDAVTALTSLTPRHSNRAGAGHCRDRSSRRDDCSARRNRAHRLHLSATPIGRSRRRSRFLQPRRSIERFVHRQSRETAPQTSTDLSRPIGTRRCSLLPGRRLSWPF